METFLQDLKFGLRTYWKTRGLTLIVVLTLALGIGSSTTVFSVIDAVLLKRLPYENPQQIMMIWRSAPIGSLFGNDSFPWSPRDFRLLEESSNTLQDLAAFRSRPFNFTGWGEPELFNGMQVSSGFFGGLGIFPVLGRTFTAEEDQPGHDKVVILSHQLWRERFGGGLGILGHTIDLNGSPYTVIGVYAFWFFLPACGGDAC